MRRSGPALRRPEPGAFCIARLRATRQIRGMRRFPVPVASQPFRVPLLLFSLLLLSSVAAHADGAPGDGDLLGKPEFAGWELVSKERADIKAVCTPLGAGVYAVSGNPVGYLATVASHKNFQLHAEYRWPADAPKNANSGVLIHIASGPIDRGTWPQCFQVQTKMGRAGDVLPMAGARFAEPLSTPPDARTQQLDRRNPSSEKPLGEWNVLEVTCKDGSILITVNGVEQNRVTGCVPLEGRIGFQLEGTPFELRSVWLKPLK